MGVSAYHEPTSVEEALSLLAQYGAAAKLVAGGQNLIPLLHQGVIEPERLVALRRIDTLREIGVDATNNQLVIGAMATQRTVAASPLVQTHARVLAEAAAAVGTVPIRNLSTLGGNVTVGDPYSDPSAALIAANARAALRSVRGERQVPMQELFTAHLRTVLADDEILVGFDVPLGLRRRSAYRKFAWRSMGGLVVGVGVTLVMRPHGAIDHAFVGLAGAGETPRRATGAEHVLAGQSPSPALFDAAAQSAAAEAEPLPSVHGSPAYRRRMLHVFTRKALDAALAEEPRE